MEGFIILIPFVLIFLAVKGIISLLESINKKSTFKSIIPDDLAKQSKTKSSHTKSGDVFNPAPDITSITPKTSIERRAETKAEYIHKARHSKQYHPMMSYKGGYAEWKADTESAIEKMYSIEQISQEIIQELNSPTPNKIKITNLRDQLELRTGKRALN